MKVDLSAPILDHRGRTQPTDQGGPLCLRDLCVIALSTPTQEDQGLTPAQRDELGTFAELISESEDVIDLTLDERGKLAERIAQQRQFSHWWVMKARRLLDTDAEPALKAVD